MRQFLSKIFRIANKKTNLNDTNKKVINNYIENKSFIQRNAIENIYGPVVKDSIDKIAGVKINYDQVNETLKHKNQVDTETGKQDHHPVIINNFIVNKTWFQWNDIKISLSLKETKNLTDYDIGINIKKPNAGDKSA